MKTLSLIFLFWLVITTDSSAAETDRFAVERDVTARFLKDMSVMYRPGVGLEGRRCLDGRLPGKDAEMIEFWASLECSYCGIRELVKAQQEHPDWCVVVRHIPASPEGLRKALSFEALRNFSTSAALTLWDAVIPKKDSPMPRPYEGALIQAYADAAISEADFSAALIGEAADIVDADTEAGRGIISSTPTYVLRASALVPVTSRQNSLSGRWIWRAAPGRATRTPRGKSARSSHAGAWGKRCCEDAHKYRTLDDYGLLMAL